MWMPFPKPPKTEKKPPKPIKRTAIVRRARWKPLHSSNGAPAALVRRTPIARSRQLRVVKTGPPKRRSPIARRQIKSQVDFAAAEVKRLERKAKRKTDRAIASHGKWPVVDGVMFISDPLNPRGQREICVTDAAWARAQAAVRRRSKGRCEDCRELAPNGDAHHIWGRTAGKRDDHPDALLNLCRRCHRKAKILRRVAAQDAENNPHEETKHGEDGQRSHIPFERHDGNPTPGGGPEVPSMLDAA
jgi:hypothetical protein